MKLSGLVIFAVLVFALLLVFVTQEKSAAQNSIPEAPPVSSEQHAVAIKAVPRAIKNAKSAGIIFEERSLFHPAFKNASNDEQLRLALSDGVSFDLNKAATQEILNENIEFLSLALPDGKGGTIRLELEKVDIFAAGFSVRTSTPTAAGESISQSFGVHYRGIIKGDERSLAAISIFKNEVLGFYSTETSGNSVLGRLGGKNLTDRHILYAEKDLKAESNFHCDIPARGDERAALPETIFQRQSGELSVRCAKIYLEADHDLFLNKGSVENTVAFLTGLFNQSLALFANDGVTISLSEIFVWNSPSPYNAASIIEALAQFRTFRTSFNGDLAHLITLNRDFGGAAYLDSLCNRVIAYGLSDIDALHQDVPTYSWSTYVLTHELGHSMGSGHTHACVWNGNNTAIDSCGPQAGFPYEGQCSNAPLPPPNGGTIMSYCHRNVGINFSLGFGTQPRNVILNKVNNAACLVDCNTNCSVTLSPAESPVFSPGFGTGAFNVITDSGCFWEATVNTNPTPLNIFSSYLAAPQPQSKNPFSSTDYAAASSQQKTPADSQISPSGLFANAAPITILDRLSNSSTSAPRAASPYPSGISVLGITGMITRARILIYGLSHASADDIDILLAAPGARNIILMSDAGGSQSLNNVDLIFDQTAPELPNEAPIISGTYRPSNFHGNPAIEPQGQDTFPPNAPSQVSYSSNLDTLNGVTPNGGWALYIMDDEHPNAGSLAAGWALEIMTNGSGGNWIVLTSAAAGAGNGTISYLVNQNNNNTPRNATIQVRGRIYTVRQRGLSESPNRTPFDFDGDAKSDLAVFRPANGYWYINNSSNNSLNAVQFGTNGDLIAPADFDGDSKTDICVFRPSDGGWYRLNSSNNTFSALQFGSSGDLPAPGDFDGDLKADISVYRPSAGTWYRINSSNNQFVGAQFGIAEDKPLVADFDGDGKSDLAVFRPSTGGWYRMNSATNTFSANQFGIAEDKPVPADFDGDGKSDIAVFRPSVGDWYIINSSTGGWTASHFGISEDKPSPGDFDGDGKADLAVWRPSSGTWYLLRTTAGFTGFQFGANGDVPAHNSYVR